MVLGLLDFRDPQGDPSFLALPLNQSCLYFPEGQVFQGGLLVQGGLDLLLFLQVQGVLADQELLVALVCLFLQEPQGNLACPALLEVQFYPVVLVLPRFLFSLADPGLLVCLRVPEGRSLGKVRAQQVWLLVAVRHKFLFPQSLDRRP